MKRFLFLSFAFFAFLSPKAQVVNPYTYSCLVTSANAESETIIRFTFNKAVESTTVGWSFKKNGVNLPIVYTTGYGTECVFKTAAFTNTDAITASYNTAGSTVDLSGNQIQYLNNYVVTNTFSPQNADFIITVKTNETDNTGAPTPNPTQFVYPLYIDGAAVASGTINWGDGSTTAVPVIVYPLPSHTYSAAGIYTVTFSGTFSGINLQAGNIYGSEPFKVLSVENWGTGATWLTWHGLFYKGKNIAINATDIPNTAAVTDIQSAFQGLINLTGTLANVYLPNVTDGSYAFYGSLNGNLNTPGWYLPACTTLEGTWADCPAYQGNGLESWVINSVTTLEDTWYNDVLFNGYINKFNTSNCTTLRRTLYHCETFNRPLDRWNTGSVTTMHQFICYGYLFNQSLNTWNTSNVTTMYSAIYNCWIYNQPMFNWNMTNVRNTHSMLESDFSFNQDVSMWDMSNDTTINYMFYHDTLFNCGGGDLGLWSTGSVKHMLGTFSRNRSLSQNLGAWDVSNLVESSTGFLDVGAVPYAMTPANLDNLFNGWAPQLLQPNITIGFGTINYTAGGAASKAILTSAPNNWIITDGGITP